MNGKRVEFRSNEQYWKHLKRAPYNVEIVFPFLLHELDRCIFLCGLDECSLRIFDSRQFNVKRV